MAKLVQYNIANEGAYDWFISQQQLAFSDAIYDQLVVAQVFWHWVLSQLFKIENQNYGANISKIIDFVQNSVYCNEKYYILLNIFFFLRQILLNILLFQLEFKVSFRW